MSSDLLHNCISSALQMLAMFGVAAWIIVRTHNGKYRLAVNLYGIALVCVGLGDLFLVLFLVLKNHWPEYFAPSDQIWLGFYCFLIVSFKELEIERRNRRWYMWIICSIPVIVHIIVSILYGSWVRNILWSIPMTILTRSAVIGMIDTEKGSQMQRFHQYFCLVVAAIMINCAMFLTWGILYVVLDVVFTGMLVLAGVTLWKEVEKP